MAYITHNYFRYFLRLLTKHSFLYTEMIHVDILLESDTNKAKRYKLMEFTEN